jgi:hypothetical protein
MEDDIVNFAHGNQKYIAKVQCYKLDVNLLFILILDTYALAD